MTIEHFLGCAESVSILNKSMKKCNVMQALTLSNEIALRHKDNIIIIHSL